MMNPLMPKGVGDWRRTLPAFPADVKARHDKMVGLVERARPWAAIGRSTHFRFKIVDCRLADGHGFPIGDGTSRAAEPVNLGLRKAPEGGGRTGGGRICLTSGGGSLSSRRGTLEAYSLWLGHFVRLKPDSRPSVTPLLFKAAEVRCQKLDVRSSGTPIPHHKSTKTHCGRDETGKTESGKVGVLASSFIPPPSSFWPC